MLNTCNENLFSPTTTTANATQTPASSSSPNRSKYEKKFLLKKSASSASSTAARKPLSEKTKVIGNASSESLPRAIEFDDLFHATTTLNDSEMELKAALGESLRENEQLCDTVKLLKCEIERLQQELAEQQEYSELYLLSKELIEQQSKEIAALKEKLKDSIALTDSCDECDSVALSDSCDECDKC